MAEGADSDITQKEAEISPGNLGGYQAGEAPIPPRAALRQGKEGVTKL